MYILQMENIKKSFGRNIVVDDVTLKVKQGEVVSIIGSSGAGKSTLLRCINRLENIQHGRISIDSTEMVKTENSGRVHYLKETELRKIRSKTAMVFQHFNLFPHLTCLENVTLTGIKIRKLPHFEVVAKAKELLAAVGLADKENQYPAQLSGGQKQRVAIARALVLDPKIILFDEPTSALDPEITGEVLTVIRKLAEKHMTMLIVTHEIAFAREVSDRLIFMDEGKIIEEGIPSEMLTSPKTERFRSFIGAMF